MFNIRFRKVCALLMPLPQLLGDFSGRGSRNQSILLRVSFLNLRFGRTLRDVVVGKEFSVEEYFISAFCFFFQVHPPTVSFKLNSSVKVFFRLLCRGASTLMTPFLSSSLFCSGSLSCYGSFCWMLLASAPTFPFVLDFEYGT